MNLRDCIAGVTDTAGTGDILIADGLAGFRAFAGTLAAGQVFPVKVRDPGTAGTANDYEIFEATFDGTATLTRGRFIDSTTGARLDLSNATGKRLYLVATAENLGPGSGRAKFALSTGSGTAFVVASPVPVKAFKNGTELLVKFHADGAAAGSTINPDALGVKSILRAEGGALRLGDIKSGAVRALVADETADCWKLKDAPFNPRWDVQSRVTTGNLTAADHFSTLKMTGTWTLSVAAASALGDGFLAILANTGTGTITITPNGADTIDGVNAAFTLAPGQNCFIECDGAAIQTVGKTYVSELAIGTVIQALVSPGGTYLKCDGGAYAQSTYASLYALLGLLPGPADPLTTWYTSGLPGTPVMRSIAYGNGKWVMVGDAGALCCSLDGGRSWVAQTSQFGGSANIAKVIFANGLFVAVGQSGKISTSPDAVTWTARTSGFGSTAILDVAYGAGVFVAVGGSGDISSSPDGITWTARTSGFSGSTINAVTFGDSTFFCVGASGKCSKSTDGITWTSLTAATGTPNLALIVNRSNKWVAFGATGSGSQSSFDMSTGDIGVGSGTIMGLGSGNNPTAAVYGGSTLVVVGAAGALASSSDDGGSWTTHTSQFGATNINAITYVNGVFIAAGDAAKMSTSTDGATWSAVTPSGSSANYCAANDNSRIAVVGGNDITRISGYGYDVTANFVVPTFALDQGFAKWIRAL